MKFNTIEEGGKRKATKMCVGVCLSNIMHNTQHIV